MTFSDIFKSSFIENVTSLSILDMVIAMALAFCLGLFIFFVYKHIVKLTIILLILLLHSLAV